MGTNFYWIDADKAGVPEELEGDRTHLGKRSASGYFCYSCDVPLVIDGNINLVHTSYDVVLDHCPVCREKRPEFHFEKSSSAVELGVAKPKFGRKTKGIATSCSFSWAQDDAMISALCERWQNEKIIVDEYGEELTGQEFMEMVFSLCPIQFRDSIGHNFS